MEGSVVRVINYRARVPAGGVVVNTTSRSAEEWSRGLSPFFLGPIELYNGYVAKTLEGAWQFSKAYQQHTSRDGSPTAAYWEWARAGWDNDKSVRYPMGRGAVPKYSLWDGEHLGYIEARKQIYCQLYSAAVEETPAWDTLVELHAQCKLDGTLLYLRDFDGYAAYDNYATVLNDPRKKMGHAFVLAMMLDDCRVWML